MKSKSAWAAMTLALALAACAGETPNSRWDSLNYALLISGKGDTCSVGLASCPVGGISSSEHH